MAVVEVGELSLSNVTEGFSLDWSSMEPYNNTDGSPQVAMTNAGGYSDDFDQKPPSSTNEEMFPVKPKEYYGLLDVVPISRRRGRIEKFDATDPDGYRARVHSFLFMAGFLFPPLWFYGVIRPAQDNLDDVHKWRCQLFAMISVIIGVTLLVLELLFRYA